MPLFPEKEPDITQRDESAPEIPEYIEKRGVVPVQTQPKKQQIVVGDKGQPLMQTPQTQAVTIQIPADPQTLTSFSKGATDDSITWFGAYWLRLIKKALHFGWQIITGRRKE